METSAGVSTETGVAPSVGLLLCTLLVIGHLRLMQQNLSFAVDQLVSFVKQVVSPEPRLDTNVVLGESESTLWVVDNRRPQSNQDPVASHGSLMLQFYEQLSSW